jgi:hypothetical protein
MQHRFALLALFAAACGSEGGGEPPGFTPRPLSFTSGDYMIEPGTEPQRCKYVDLPVDGDYLIAGYHAEMLPGSHHFNMFHADPLQGDLVDVPRDELIPCRSVPFPVYLAGSQWVEVDQTFPAGLAARIPAGSLIIMEIHYVNSTDAPIPARLDVEFTEADPATVEHELGLYFNILEDLRVQPGQRARLSGRCPIDEGANIVLLTSHMHHFGEAFEINLIDEATLMSTPVYLSEDWSHPLLLEMWEQPLVGGDGQSLEWACTYVNPGPDVLTGGGSAETDEMCMMAAFYWPNLRPHPYCFSDPTIEILD